MAQGTFPNSVKISVRAVGWFESEIDDWLKARTKQSTNAIRVTNKDGGRS
jgi:predicted DNA-binding transcriptional regulator AlpA